MPRRFFKRFSLKRHRFSEQRAMRPFRHLLSDHRLWGIRRQTVVPAFALGAFFAWMPFPGHPVVATLAALWRRVNVPVAAVTTFVSNPITIPFMYFAAYRLGAFFLRVPPRPFEFELTLDWFLTGFVQIWKPLLLGCVTLGAFSALVAYAVLDLLWRRSVVTYKLRKRAIRQRREQSVKQD